jgi:hypothetical protein
MTMHVVYDRITPLGLGHKILGWVVDNIYRKQSIETVDGADRKYRPGLAPPLDPG